MISFIMAVGPHQD